MFELLNQKGQSLLGLGPSRELFAAGGQRGPAFDVATDGDVVSANHVENVSRPATVQTLAAHRDHAATFQAARRARFVILKVRPLVALEPTYVAIGPKALESAGAGLLFATQQAVGRRPLSMAPATAYHVRTS
ncbi:MULTISPECIES: hypothetical protein [unclassified Bradyrhizobium]|uniref:hypothetical protein n=1 Tax=unclassified Bradyrhizobium TaxID=2631580 RepID=UPI001FFB6852|nr:MULTISPECIES: hypothetical protein [unclassified Bradyrhizobium]